MSDVYTVRVTREGDAWLADVDGLDGAHTYARNLPALRKSVVDVIILMDDLDDDARPDFALRFGVEDPLVLSAVFLGDERAVLERRADELIAETRSLARSLADAGWSVRDAADMLRITPGRVSQLTRR